MRTFVTSLCALMLASAFLAGCGRELPKAPPPVPKPQVAAPAPTPPAPPVKAEPPKPALALPAIDISTPENAVKSFWATQDMLWGLRYKVCEDCRTVRSHQKDVTTGDMLESFQYTNDTPIAVEREIKESKPSKKTKDVVEITAVVKNVTPYPKEAVAPNDYVKKKRENGDKYRYSLTHTGEGWKISEISLWYEPTRTWLKITSPKPLVPIQTYP